MKCNILLLLVLAAVTTTKAQDGSPSEAADEKRYSFAETYFGVEMNYMPHYQPSVFVNPSGNTQSFDRPAFLAPSVTIGGTHFWGYVDFFVSIATRNINLSRPSEETPRVYNDLNTMTGLKIYPLALRNKTIRPYVGFKFSPVTYTQTNEDQFEAQVTQVKSMFDVGVGFTNRFLYAYVGYTRIINPNYLVPISKTQFETVQIIPHFISFGINYKLETTKPLVKSRFHKRLHEKMAQTNGLGFFVGAGPSAAFPTRNSSYLTEFRPYLDQRAMPSIFPDFSVGYHFSKTDLNVALSYRFYGQSRSGFDVSHRLNRHSLLLEGYKFLGDYHGFVPFIGGGVSYESIRFQETEAEEQVADFTTQKFTPVLTVGWDIRPARKGDWWLLRTNLRYMPFLDIQHQGKALSLQHLEFNFIQFVIYPQRLAQRKTLDPHQQ